jgi:large subunit ribosomal protein L9
MEIILTQDVDKVGSYNEVVTVRAGFGRNYLIPKGWAMMANESNKKMIAEKMKQYQAKQEKLTAELRGIADILNNSVITVGAKTGTSGKIFGAVTAIQIADAIKKQKNVEVDRKKIHLSEEVKMLGTFSATINLHKDIIATINVEVVAE